MAQVVFSSNCIQLSPRRLVVIPPPPLPPLPRPSFEPPQSCYASAVATETQNETSYLAEMPIDNINLVGMLQGYHSVADLPGFQVTMAILNHGMEWTPNTYYGIGIHQIHGYEEDSETPNGEAIAVQFASYDKDIEEYDDSIDYESEGETFWCEEQKKYTQ